MARRYVISLILIALAGGCGDRSHGGSTVPTPDPSDQAADAERYAQVDTDLIGARIGSLVNQLTTNDPLRFDRAVWDTGGFWDPGQPTRATIPADGIYRVRVQLTILGSGYPDSPPAGDTVLTVVRNGDRDDFVCFNRKSDERPEPALALHCGTTDWYLAGDYLEVLVTPDRTVESNWPGRGNVSPILLVIRED